ncbi:MAG: hypothetical protein M1814_000642 [Vezdaea aestivalis]|nr:MAG: hypothetical protein M1814_000642 [Vezdaea aestivalis]
MKLLVATALSLTFLFASATPTPPFVGRYGIHRRSANATVVYNFDNSTQSDYLTYQDIKTVDPTSPDAPALISGLNATSSPNVGYISNGFAFFSAQNKSLFGLRSVVVKARGTNEVIFQGFGLGNSSAKAEAKYTIGGPDDKQLPQNFSTYSNFHALESLAILVQDQDENLIPFVIDDLIVTRESADSPY